MAIETNIDITYFIRTNLYVQNFMADSEKLVDICFKTIFTVNRVEN